MSLTALPGLFRFGRNSETVNTLRYGRNVRTKAVPNVSCRLHRTTQHMNTTEHIHALSEIYSSISNVWTVTDRGYNLILCL